MRDLFVPSHFAFQNWVRVYNYYDGVFEIDFIHMRNNSLLWWASLHGLTAIVEWLLPSASSQREMLEAF